MLNAGVVVAVYDGYREAEQGVRELRRACVDMKCVSIAAKDSCTGEDVVGYYSTGDRMKYWGKAGSVWGESWELLPGAALFAIPSIGSVLVAGSLVNLIVKGLEEGVVVDGISAVGSGLLSIGISKTDVMQYEADLKKDKFILLVHGDPQTLVVAESRRAFAVVGRDRSDQDQAQAVVPEGSSRRTRCRISCVVV